MWVGDNDGVDSSGEVEGVEMTADHDGAGDDFGDGGDVVEQDGEARRKWVGDWWAGGGETTRTPGKRWMDGQVFSICTICNLPTKDS